MREKEGKMHEHTPGIIQEPEDIAPQENKQSSKSPGLRLPCAGDRSTQEATVALIDHRSFFLQCLKTFLGDYSNNFKLIATKSSCDFVNNVVERTDDFDIILFSIGNYSFLDERIREDVKLLRAHFPNKPLVVLIDLDVSNCVLAALESVDEDLVQGFITTSDTPAAVVEQLRLVLAGGTCFPVRALIQPHNVFSPKGKSGEVQRNQIEQGEGKLTPRQLEVAAVLRKGKPNKLIAYELGMKESTVKVHVRHIMKKMNANNRTEAAVRVEKFFGD
jgi:DNA-binding NarL/FixJ family response regulator